MKIDFVITELDVGGAEKALTKLAGGLCSRGHHVRVLSIGSPPPPPRDRLIRQLADFGVPVDFGGFDRSTNAFAAYRWLSRQLRQSRPDLCQTFLFHANCLGTWAARTADVPVVVGGLRVAEARRGRLLCERIAASKMDHVVCVSSKVRDFAIERLGVPVRRCSVIENGVDAAGFRSTEPFRWSRLGWPDDSLVVVYVGRLHPQKGLELITEDWTRISELTPDCKLVIAGEGPLRQSIQRWADDVGPDRVRVLPWQPDVAPLLKAAGLLLLPSHYEGMPNVVLEAMAAGRAVACSRVHGCEELLAGSDSLTDAPDVSVDRMAEQSFPSGDGDAMVRCVTELLRRRERAALLGRLNQQHVEQRFTYSQMVSRYETLYAELIRGGSQSPPPAQHQDRP